MTSRKTELSITGMSCATCAQRIEKGLSQLEGVESANVNLATERATIIYEPDKVSEEQFIQLIRDFGYDVAEPGEIEDREKAGKSVV